VGAVRANRIWQWALALTGLSLGAWLAVELAGHNAPPSEYIWLFLILFGLLLSAGFSLFFTRASGLRIQRLEKFSRRVAGGDFRPLTPDNSNDELALLTRAMNETALRLAQTIRSLTEEHGRTAAILESMAEGVAVVGADERVVYSNAAFAQILGSGTNVERTNVVGPNGAQGGDGILGRSTGQGRRLVELVRQTELLGVVKKALSSEQRVESEVTVGTVRLQTFAVTAAPVPASEKGGTAIGAVLVLHDISELRRLERVRQDFVANVSHEFKTPLTAIRGFAETLLSGALEDVDHRKRFVEIIQEHAERLTRLTDDLLKLSTIEAGKMDLELRTVTPADLVKMCVDTASFAAKKKQQTIKVDCARELPAVRGDSGRLRDVLQNLLDNAVQYTPAGGHIIASAAKDGAEIVFTVADNGIGIPQAEQERIFERFYRVDEGRSREVGGTGLGLSIARHIAEAHGGRIWVESAIGQGSRFHFSVPIAG
jgi:two-component system, OmpR family, phosphate regulon sensor histidine kinase PhoR